MIFYGFANVHGQEIIYLENSMFRVRRVPIVRQITQTECGLCCCVMLLRYYGSKESIFDLHRYMDVGRDGLSIYQLKNLLDERGLHVKIYSTDDIEKLKLLDLPFICYWNKQHFVVVTKIHKNQVYINDPAEGNKIIDIKEFEECFSQYFIVAKPKEDFTPLKKSTYNPWKKIFRYITEKKLLLVQIFACLLIVYGITLYLPNIIQRIVDEAMQESRVTYLNEYIKILFLCLLGYSFGIIIENLRIITMNVHLSIKLEANTYKRLMHLPYKFFETRSSGDLLFRVQCTSRIKEMIVSQLFGTIINLGTLLVVIIYMIKKSVILTTLVLCIFSISVLLFLLIQPVMSQAINGEVIEQTKSQTAQIESLYAIITIKMAAMEDIICNNWQTIFERVIKMFKRRTFITNIYNALLSMLQVFAPIVVICFGIVQYYKGNMSLGEVIAFESMANTFFSTGMSIVAVIPQIATGAQYLDRISEIWRYEIEEESTDVLECAIQGEIELKSVAFSYTSNSPVVCSDISMHIKPGTKIAIVGESGSGKSTLGKILVGLYQPTEGSVLYDGNAFNQYNRKSLCSQMGIVPQDATLFNKTIYENIVLERKDIKFEDVVKATKMACIHDEIMAMPMGYNTLVSEMGVNLSGGQRQRILIARALLTNPKILVMDEATSSLDNINEKHISDYLAERKCTRIIVAHRLSTIIDSDCIYVMQEGKIVEIGKHEELLQLDGTYAKLYKMNSKEK